jgi:hypothetical protein
MVGWNGCQYLFPTRSLRIASQCSANDAAWAGPWLESLPAGQSRDQALAA